MKCKTGNDRWWGQTGKSKEQSNSTSRALDSGHSAAGCDCGVTDCGLQRKEREDDDDERMCIDGSGVSLVCFFYQLSNIYGAA